MGNETGSPAAAMSGKIMSKPDLAGAISRRRPVCYVIGKWRDRSSWLEEANVREAEKVGLDLIRMGYAPICVHTMCRNYPGALPIEDFFECDGELIRRADCAFILPNWETSEGSKVEAQFAMRHERPLLSSWEMAQDFVRDWHARESESANAIANAEIEIVEPLESGS